jgi:hypothetical protein
MQPVRFLSQFLMSYEARPVRNGPRGYNANDGDRHNQLNERKPRAPAPAGGARFECGFRGVMVMYH